MTSTVLSASIAIFLVRYPSVMHRSLLSVLLSICFFFNGIAASAQSSGKARATQVEVTEVTTETIADFSELQGRLVAGATESITAVTNAKIEILDLQLGDFVRKGQNIAKQDSGKLVLNRTIFEAQLTETKIEHNDILAEIETIYICGESCLCLCISCSTNPC